MGNLLRRIETVCRAVNLLCSGEKSSCFKDIYFIGEKNEADDKQRMEVEMTG